MPLLRYIAQTNLLLDYAICLACLYRDMSDTESPAKRHRLSNEPEASNTTGHTEIKHETTLPLDLKPDDIEENTEQEHEHKKSDKGKGRATDVEEDDDVTTAETATAKPDTKQKKQKFVPVHGTHHWLLALSTREVV